CPGHTPAYPSEVDRELRREWPRRELGERETFDIILLRDPAPFLDEITLHVAHQCDGPTEARRAQAEKVPEQLTQRARSQAFGRRPRHLELHSRGRHVSSPSRSYGRLQRMLLGCLSCSLAAEVLVQGVEHGGSTLEAGFVIPLAHGDARDQPLPSPSPSTRPSPT